MCAYSNPKAAQNFDAQKTETQQPFSHAEMAAEHPTSEWSEDLAGTGGLGGFLDVDSLKYAIYNIHYILYNKQYVILYHL